MENRKLLKLIPIFILGFFVAQINNVFAYSVETHAYLTSEVVKFYNQNLTKNKISDELTPYLIDGSRREDDAPRWMNHFYDPVYNRGLTDSILGIWQKSKDWAQDSNNQNNLTYKVPATIASVLTAIQQRAISVLTTETDFTWQRAIKFYVQGEKEKAMFALGHILHLLEDKAVPDHTRNDPHPGDSHYENYAAQFTFGNPDKNLPQHLKNKAPIIFINPNSYFDELAGYSNNNFYSKDTIGIQGGYNLPELDYIKKDGVYYYGFKLDNENKEYHLLAYIRPPSKYLWAYNEEVTLKDAGQDFIVSDYWSRLSAKSVQYGAGVINLFFREVEKAKNDPNFAKAEEKSFFSETIDAAKNLLAQVGGFFSGIFSGEDDFQPVGQISLDDNQFEEVQSSQINEESQGVEPQKQTNKSTNQQNQSLQSTEAAGNEVQPGEIEQGENQDTQSEQEIVATQNQTATSTSQSQAATFKECSFNTTQIPSHQKVIISEVAWMGNATDANDEWIELKNISGGDVDVSGWQLIDQGEQIKINLGLMNKIKIAAGGFILLERTDDNSVSNTTADLIYTGALSNTNEGLRLFDDQCNLIDEVLANPDWPAGDNTSAAARKTMERDSTGFGWHISSIIGGTPKATNSQPTLIYSGGGGSSPSVPSNEQQQTPVKILINEVQTFPTGERFVELYNPNNSAVNLTNWYIQRKTRTGSSFDSLVSKTYFENKTIGAYGYFLISRAALDGADIVLDNLTLTESNTIQLKNQDAEVIDKVGWGSTNDCENGCVTEPSNNQSIQRKFQNNTFIDTNNNASDFEIQTCPSPKVQSRDCTIGAVQNFNLAYSPSTMGLIFNWQSPLGYNTATSSLIYKITEINNVSSTLPVIETASTTATIFINEVGRDYQFSIQAFDNGLGLATSAASTTVPSFLSGLYFYQNPQASSTNYLIEAYYNQYPFVPDLYGQNKWSLLVFYLNNDAKKDLNDFSWQPNDLGDVLALKYNQCAGGSFANTLLLPNDVNHCGTDGGAYNAALSFNQLEDNHFIIKTASSSQDFAFTNNDFIATAFYSTRSVQTLDGTMPNFQLIAIDKTKYYLGQLPTRQTPTTPTNFQVVFQEQSETPYFSVSWTTSIDPDSLDQEISYQLDYWLESNSNSKQQWLGKQNPIQINPPSSGNYIFELKSFDEFNLYSESVFASSTAFMPIVLVDTNNYSNWNNLSFGGKNSLGENSTQKIAQKFYLSQTANITSVTIGLANCWECDNPSGAKISLRQANGEVPSDNEITTFHLTRSEIPRYNRDAYNNGVKDFSFLLSPAVELSAGNYFLVIEPEDSPAVGFWNLISLYSGSDPYPECSLYVYYNQQTGQWTFYGGNDTYFRIKGF